MNIEKDELDHDLSSKAPIELDSEEQTVITVRFGGETDKLLYALEKTHMAVYELAIGRGNLRARFPEAFAQLIRIDMPVLPDHLQLDFTWIMESLTAKPAKQRRYVNGKWIEGYEGRIGATLAYMRYNKMEEIARRIYDFNSRLEAVVES